MVRQVCFNIQSEEEVDFLLRLELGCNLGSGDDGLLIGGAINKGRHIQINIIIIRFKFKNLTKSLLNKNNQINQAIQIK